MATPTAAVTSTHTPADSPTLTHSATATATHTPLATAAVPKKYGSNRQKIEIDAIESLQQLFARGRQVRGSRRGSVVAV